MYLTQSLHRAVRQSPDIPFTAYRARTYTARETYDAVSRIAGGLIGLGVRKDDRVGLLSLNTDRFCQAALATAWADAAIVPLNTRWSVAEHAYALDDADVSVLFLDDAFLPMASALRERTPGLRTIVHCGDQPTPEGLVPLAELLAAEPVEDVHRQGDAMAGVFYTGGTTGVSKAVRTTHANMRAGIEILRITMAEHTCGAGGLVVSVHPFSHAAGMSVNLLQYSSRGVTQLLFPKMIDAERVVAGWRGRPINSILAGPAFHNRLMATPGFAELDFSALRSGLVGGMPLRPDIRDRFEQITGKPLLQGYGLTETSVPIAGELGFERHVGSVGFPFPSVDLTMRDPDQDDLRAVPPGAIGEVWLRGPFMMSGYYQRPDETARAITADGWFRTGDLGRMESSGALYLLGRIKDMILVDGANVYPAAIEDVVGAHPGVADVCAVGMADEEDGERVRLFVVRRDPGLDEATVAQWCAERLSHFKLPKRIEFVDALPRSAVDKLLRRELSERPLT